MVKNTVHSATDKQINEHWHQLEIKEKEIRLDATHLAQPS